MPLGDPGSSRPAHSVTILPSFQRVVPQVGVVCQKAWPWDTANGKSTFHPLIGGASMLDLLSRSFFKLRLLGCSRIESLELRMLGHKRGQRFSTHGT